MKLCGIYLITHPETGRKYVGQSVNVHSRWGNHSRGTKATKLGCAILHYGWAAFTTEILEFCSRESLNEAEQRWVKTLNCVSPFGFNLTTGGSLQCEYSDETKAKISKANSRRVVSDATKQKMSARIITKETRLKLSAAHTGKTISETHRKALLTASRLHAHINIPRLAELNRGSKRTPEQIARITAVHIGAKRSPETKAKISAALKGKLLGKSHTEEHKAKVSAALMGHKHSAETRAKIGEAAKGRKQSAEHIAKAQANKAANRLLRNRTSITAAGDLLA